MRNPILKISFIAAAMLLMFGLVAGWAQITTPNNLDCAVCKNTNEWSYKFCINCGAALTVMKENKLVELQREREIVRQKFVADSLARIRVTEAMQRERAATIRDTSRVNLAPQFASTAVSRPEAVRMNAATAKPAAPQQRDEQRWYKTMLREPAILPRLFNVPTANVLGSLDLYFTGGGAFGIEKERNFLGRAGLGLGDIAEVEFATQSVINSLQHGSSSLPTSAFKMLLLRERTEGLPAIAMALRGTTSWRYLVSGDLNGNFSFETRLTKLYFVGTKHVGKVSGHLGVGLTDVRVRNISYYNYLRNEMPVVFTAELQRNLWAPFGGLSIQANPKTQVMIEIEGLPSYDFRQGNSYRAGDIKNIWAGVFGVRFYFANWLAADTGVRYRSDFDGIADSNIQANINILLPVGRLRQTGKAE